MRTYYVMVRAENVVARNAVALHFPDIVFTNEEPFHLWSDISAKDMETCNIPIHHLGRLLGTYGNDYFVILNTKGEFKMWKPCQKRFDHPLFGSPKDYDRLCDKKCAHLFESMPLLLSA